MENNVYQKHRSKALESMEAIGLAGSFVGVNQEGVVCAQILSSEQILQLLQLYDNPKDIPWEYSIYDDEGNCLTQ